MFIPICTGTAVYMNLKIIWFFMLNVYNGILLKKNFSIVLDGLSLNKKLW